MFTLVQYRWHRLVISLYRRKCSVSGNKMNKNTSSTFFNRDFLFTPREAHEINHQTSQVSQHCLYIADALNVLANQIVLFFITRRHMEKSGKIRKQDNSAHLSEDFPYSVSVTALHQTKTRCIWGNQINGYFNQHQNWMRIFLIPSMLPFRWNSKLSLLAQSFL